MTLALVAALALVSLAAILALRDAYVRHTAHVAALLEAQAAERVTWDYQRWDLNTRLTTPGVITPPPAAPPAPPADDADDADDPDDVDESHLVGTIG